MATSSPEMWSTPSDPPVTVLMPTYNQQDYVGAAIAAILGQRAAPFELLIADDCSSDATWDRITQAVAGYAGPHRLRLMRNDANLGINGNLNRMIAAAGGTILIAAAGDDVSFPDRVSRIVATFRDQRPLLVHSGFRPLVAPGRRYDGMFDNLIFTRTTDPVAIAGSPALFVGATAAWHRDLFDLFGPLPDGQVYEDLVLGFRAALAGRVAMIDAPLVDYRIGSGVSFSDAESRRLQGWTTYRLWALNGQAALFRQRRKDALAFGLAEDSAVVRALDWHLASTQVRMDACVLPALPFLRRHLHHPILAMRRLRSERRRARRALLLPAGP